MPIKISLNYTNLIYDKDMFDISAIALYFTNEI